MKVTPPFVTAGRDVLLSDLDATRSLQPVTRYFLLGDIRTAP